MSIEAMNWALAQETGSPAAKCVLLILANRADHLGKCWPGFGGIRQQTELSRRAVIDNIKLLQRAGHISITARPRPLTNLYQLNLSSSAADALVQEMPHTSQTPHEQAASEVNSAADALVQEKPGGASDALPVVQELHLGSAGAAPEPSINPNKTQRGRKRATRIPDDFELTDERRLVAEAETLPADRTFAKFVDYWTAVSDAKGRKLDWDATWRNWCRNEADRFGGGSTGPKRKQSYAERTAEYLRSASG